GGKAERSHIEASLRIGQRISLEADEPVAKIEHEAGTESGDIINRGIRARYPLVLEKLHVVPTSGRPERVLERGQHRNEEAMICANYLVHADQLVLMHFVPDRRREVIVETVDRSGDIRQRIISFPVKARIGCARN